MVASALLGFFRLVASSLLNGTLRPAPDRRPARSIVRLRDDWGMENGDVRGSVLLLDGLDGLGKHARADSSATGHASGGGGPGASFELGCCGLSGLCGCALFSPGAGYRGDACADSIDAKGRPVTRQSVRGRWGWQKIRGKTEEGERHEVVYSIKRLRRRYAACTCCCTRWEIPSTWTWPGCPCTLALACLPRAAPGSLAGLLLAGADHCTTRLLGPLARFAHLPTCPLAPNCASRFLPL